MINYVKGDLIRLAKSGEFDVITHGCNCFCKMGAGIAPKMAKAFGCDKFEMELTETEEYDDDGVCYTIPTNNVGNINKLGNIDFKVKYLWFSHPEAEPGLGYPMNHKAEGQSNVKDLYVVNSYTQYHWGKNRKGGIKNPIDYEALTLCMRKINSQFKEKHIGLPKIGAGLAGGDWNKIERIIEKELKGCKVTVVVYHEN